LNVEGLIVKNSGRIILVLVFCLNLSLTVAHSEPPTAPQMSSPTDAAPETELSYYIEISINRNTLTLYEKKSATHKSYIAEYPVGTAIRGLKTYPLGLGTVTGTYFNPWWYPTPYSRQVFRDRGIDLPKAVPPGDPQNYMGPFKIALSHRTSKGAIYRIHGNNNPKRVGHRVTGGCFVMDNATGIALAHKIRVGTEVNIVP
jgi:lipoprotein-anchoring transpeptidase ErfK/SrfK